jgi:predicted DNA-binding transcriptional regulator YafY
VGKSPNGYKGKMKGDCAAVMGALIRRRRVSVEELMRDRGISRRTAYEWLEAIKEEIPITVKGGVAVVDEEYKFSNIL